MAKVRDDAIAGGNRRLTGEDDGPPTGAQHGETHAGRMKNGHDPWHGPKTRAANREKVKGSPLHNPR